MDQDKVARIAALLNEAATLLESEDDLAEAYALVCTALGSLPRQ